MSKAVTSMEYWDVLKELIDLPEEVTEFSLHCNVNELVRVEIKAFAVPHRVENGKLATSSKKYKLIELDVGQYL